MALESATYINALVPTNPPASDPIAQAANHLNLIKTVLQATFPHATAPLSATMENLNNGTPVGLIAMWSGSALPAGWTLCNGVAVPRMDGTGNITPPDLRDRFLVGSGLSYPLAAVGGNAVFALSVAQLPSHSHTASDSGHGHSVNESPHSHGIPVSGGPGGLGFSEPGSANGNTVQTSTASTGISVAAGNAQITVASGNANITIGATGSGAAIENRPPFYALAFIMKV